MNITVDDMLLKRNKTRYWLSEETGIRYHNLLKICSGKTSSINFDTIEKICAALECTPNDILEIKIK